MGSNNGGKTCKKEAGRKDKNEQECTVCSNGLCLGIELCLVQVVHVCAVWCGMWGVSEIEQEQNV